MQTNQPGTPGIDIDIDIESARELETIAVAAAVAAGRLIHDERPAQLTTASTKTSDTDVVTIMDTRAEALLGDFLRAARPGDGFYGEEGAPVASATGITWVVDPVDGTVNYLYGVPMYAVSVAAVVGEPDRSGEWTPVAGAVCAPGLDTVWSAARGGGARRRTMQAGLSGSPGETVQVGRCADLAMALVGTGFAYLAEERARQGRVLASLLPSIRDIRRLGSAAIDLCLIADGRLDAYFEAGLRPWDVAAGWLMIAEAGGRVVGPRGAGPDRTLTLAGNLTLVSDLLKRVDPDLVSDDTPRNSDTE